MTNLTVLNTESKGKAPVNTPAGPSYKMSNSVGVVKPYPFPSRPAPYVELQEKEVVVALETLLQGTTAKVIGRETDVDLFNEVSLIYNGAIRCYAYAIVQVMDAKQVSLLVTFCRQHHVEVSVKAGGTSVHGKSLAGHVVIDLGLMKNVSVALPESSPTLYESLTTLEPSKDIPIKQDIAIPSGKRSADDALLLSGDGDLRGKSRTNSTDSEGLAMSMSNSESNSLSGSGSGSGSGFSSGSRHTPSNDSGGSHTPDTSHSSGEANKQPTILYSNPAALPRTTYVNPSPTSTSSFPFVSSSFGAGPSTPHPRSHSIPGEASLNFHPNPPAYTIVTFGAGTYSTELDAATSSSPYGAFFVPTSAFPVGAGQFLLGGFGFLGRKHGLAMDNLVEAEVVLADGRIVWVGAEGHRGDWKEGESPDELWYALRGAGPAFGVVTRYRAKAYYLPSVFAGNFIFVFNPATAPSLFRHVRDCVKGASRSFYANIIMTAGPPGTPAIIVIQLCYSGSREEGELYVQAIGAWNGDRCLFQDFSERSFLRQQAAVEEVVKGGKGRKWYIKSDILSSMTDDVIDQTCARFHGAPDGCTWLFEYIGGGALADVKDTCFPHRDAAFTVAALHQWSHTEAPVEDTRCVTTAEEWIDEVIKPHSPGGPLPCFQQSSEERDVAAMYGQHYQRLVSLKKVMDPDRIFKHAIWPSGDDLVDGVEGAFSGPGGDGTKP